MHKKAQSSIEYVFLICLIAAGLIAMQFYFKRSVQGSLRNTASQISDGGMYSPGVTIADNMIKRKIIETSASTTTDGSEGSITSVIESGKSISQSNTTIEQSISKNEQIGSISDEPKR